MKAFLAAVVAAVVIAVAAGVILNLTDMTTSEKFASDTVRLE